MASGGSGRNGANAAPPAATLWPGIVNATPQRPSLAGTTAWATPRKSSGATEGGTVRVSQKSSLLTLTLPPASPFDDGVVFSPGDFSFWRGGVSEDFTAMHGGAVTKFIKG